MKLLKEIRVKETPDEKLVLGTREASRAVLFDKDKLVPLLFVSRVNYHKLPGGGIAKGENRIEALQRECLEEVGSKIKITGEGGKIVEFRYKFNLKQTSYCYYGEIVSKGKPTFTERELKQGFQVVWMSLDEAISKVENDDPMGYEGAFIQKRDLVFLKEAKKVVGVR